MDTGFNIGSFVTFELFGISSEGLFSDDGFDLFVLGVELELLSDLLLFVIIFFFLLLCITRVCVPPNFYQTKRSHHLKLFLHTDYSFQD